VKWKMWWIRSRLRTKIFCAFSALILAVLLITLWFSQLVISRQAQATLQQELATTGQVFKGLLDERVKRLQTNATLLVRDYALQKVIASYDPPTIASALLSYQQRLAEIQLTRQFAKTFDRAGTKDDARARLVIEGLHCFAEL